MRLISQKRIKDFFSKKNFLIPIKVIFTVLFLYILLGTNAFSNENPFFSYKRFFISENTVSGGTSQGLVQRDLEAFIRAFNSGLYYFSEDKYKEAEKSLQKARQLWPEYYATDFVLAGVYEKLGEYSIAARYYKSYLQKLNKLRNGSYRLTGPLMISFNSDGIESYKEAYMHVKNRVTENGINFDKVVPAFEPAGKLLAILIIIITGTVIVFINNKLQPYLRKRKRIINAPEGFWGCHNCGTYNPDLRNECEECGRAKSLK